MAGIGDIHAGKRQRGVTAIELFAGAGGLALGFLTAKISLQILIQPYNYSTRPIFQIYF